MMQPTDKNNHVYKSWTDSTIECLKAECNCSKCGRYGVCYSKADFISNEYGMKPIKYLVLKLYARHGRPEGIKYGS